MNNMESRYDRPDDWLGGYGPANSPVRAYGEKLVCSPKKKTSWRVAKDAKAQESLPAPVPDIDKPSEEGKVQPPQDLKKPQVTTATDAEEYVEEEVFTESDNGEEYVEELVVYSDESDESSEYSEDEEIEILEVEEQPFSRFDSESEDFESLPPPINIPNELRPSYLREKGPSSQESIDESSITAGSEEEAPAPAIKEAPRVSESLRPTTLRGMSFDSSDGDQPAKPARRAGTRPKQKEQPDPTPRDSVDDDKETEEETPVPEVKEAPAVITESLRPTTVRGMSFDSDDDQPAKPARRAGTRSKPTEPEAKPQIAPCEANDDNDEIDEGKKAYSWEQPSWTQPHLKPTGKADVMKTEGNLATPITHIKDVVETEKKELNFKKPQWTRESSLRGTKKGEKLKSGEDIKRPIGGIRLVDE